MPDAEHLAHGLAPDGTCQPVRSPAYMRHGTTARRTARAARWGTTHPKSDPRA